MKREMKEKIKNAPKFGLFIEGAGWLANTQFMNGIVFTDSQDLAMQFSEGFDDPVIKLGIWNAEAKKMFNCDIKFEPVYL